MKKQSRKKGTKNRRQPGVAGAAKATAKQPKQVKPKKQLETTVLAPAAGELAISATPATQAEAAESAPPQSAVNSVGATPPKHSTPWHHIVATGGGALVAL